MVRVMASGVFDIIHPGHIFYFEKAKELGDELWVVVANDKTVKRKKREPIMPQEARARVVLSLKPVDKVVIGNADKDFFEIVKEIKPDIIALGFDQKFDEKDLKSRAKETGLDIKVVRLPKLDHEITGTTKIISKIVEDFSKIEK
jgi:Glycerol-3-phosphate cytidylyltransferase (EC 2.7.7.39)